MSAVRSTTPIQEALHLRKVWQNRMSNRFSEEHYSTCMIALAGCAEEAGRRAKCLEVIPVFSNGFSDYNAIVHFVRNDFEITTVLGSCEDTVVLERWRSYRLVRSYGKVCLATGNVAYPKDESLEYDLYRQESLGNLTDYLVESLTKLVFRINIDTQSMPEFHHLSDDAYLSIPADGTADGTADGFPWASPTGETARVFGEPF